MITHFMASLIIAIGWIVFWLYWIISASRSKKSTVSHGRVKQFIGVRLGFFVVAVIVAAFTHSLYNSFENHYHSITSKESVLILGLILYLLGITLAVWARIYLGKNWGMPMTEKQDPELVTTGPYRYVRHPIYTGFLMMILGSAADVNAFWIVIFVAASAYFIYSAVAEEKMLTEQLPKAYPTYRAKTKMLIPFIF